MSEEIRVPRTGQAPLSFQGTLLAEVDTSTYGRGNSRFRWFVLRLYRVEESVVAGDPQYVIRVEFHTCWGNEHDTNRAEYGPADWVVSALRSWRWEDDLAPSDPGESDPNEKHRKWQLRQDYERGVTELLDGLPEADAARLVEAPFAMEAGKEG